MKKSNPLNLNKLQLKTLALLQECANETKKNVSDIEVTLHSLPQPHGDHFHVGNKLVMSKDATGLSNPSVWKALERKGLISGKYPIPVTITKTGLNYEIK